ncbi:hypothetical protein ACOSP7_015602 [Xanthoceras sorbifolium]
MCFVNINSPFLTFCRFLQLQFPTQTYISSFPSTLYRFFSSTILLFLFKAKKFLISQSILCIYTCYFKKPKNQKKKKSKKNCKSFPSLLRFFPVEAKFLPDQVFADFSIPSLHHFSH